MNVKRNVRRISLTATIIYITLPVIMPNNDKYIRKTKPTYIALSDADYNKLRSLAVEEGLSLAEVLARLAHEYIARRTGKPNTVQQK